MKEILYDDGLIKLDSEGLTIRFYYFPLGTSKHIPYTRIKSVQERSMGPLTGKGRLWGSGDLQHWASLDLRRPQKEKLLILDVGTWVKPIITPDDPDRVLALLQERILHNIE
ncbi:MAG TPA: hypothetical protein VFB12_19190 [Ktedonobacteraceae bacterium]|nr:hypothetical protein [Ktedonobacteraceae bacterium]